MEFSKKTFERCKTVFKHVNFKVLVCFLYEFVVFYDCLCMLVEKTFSTSFLSSCLCIMLFSYYKITTVFYLVIRKKHLRLLCTYFLFLDNVQYIKQKKKMVTSIFRL